MKLILALIVALTLFGCKEDAQKSASGVKKADVTVLIGADGFTVEQKNVRERLLLDNKTGSIKHLYIISAYSGQTIIYSTVRGKVTSSGKRLSPASVAASDAGHTGGIPVSISGNRYRTGEVLQDDGTYGSSVEYLYWWDVQGRYHQHYVSGGQIVHISDQPIPVKSVTINMELAK